MHGLVPAMINPALPDSVNPDDVSGIVFLNEDESQLVGLDDTMEESSQSNNSNELPSSHNRASTQVEAEDSLNPAPPADDNEWLQQETTDFEFADDFDPNAPHDC